MRLRRGSGPIRLSDNVVDLEDYFQNHANSAAALGGMLQRKTRGLLPPIPVQTDTPRSTRSTSAGRPHFHPHQSRRMGQVTELIDSSNEFTPSNLEHELEHNPQEQVMRIIDIHNAANPPGVDLLETADFVANVPSNFDLAQRNQPVDFVKQQSSYPSTAGPGSAAPSLPPLSSNVSSTPRNKTTASPSLGTNMNNSAAPSLSPIMHPPALPPLPFGQISSNQNQLDRLQELQRQQDARINELNDMLGPLSPSGRIPGIDDTEDAALFDPRHVDLDDFFNSEAFLDDPNFGGTGSDFHGNFDNSGNIFDTRNNNTPSPTETEEMQPDDLDTAGNTTQSKKRRMS